MAKAPPKPHVLIAQNLHALRLRVGMTQEVLAERANVDLRSLQRTEAGTWNMTVGYLARFQEALGCRWRDLVAGLDTLSPTASKMIKLGKAAEQKANPRAGGKVTPKGILKQDRRAELDDKQAQA